MTHRRETVLGGAAVYADHPGLCGNRPTFRPSGPANRPLAWFAVRVHESRSCYRRWVGMVAARSGSAPTLPGDRPSPLASAVRQVA
jgi:hypothetical protein